MRIFRQPEREIENIINTAKKMESNQTIQLDFCITILYSKRNKSLYRSVVYHDQTLGEEDVQTANFIGNIVGGYVLPVTSKLVWIQLHFFKSIFKIDFTQK